MAQSNRAYSNAHFSLLLDGDPTVRMIKSIEGGGLKADVMTYQNGSNYDRWRQIGKPKFEDLKITVGLAMAEPYYDWMSSFFDGNVVRKNGSVLAGDFNFSALQRRDFFDALIKDITFPALDASSNSPLDITFSLAVENIAYMPGDGSKMQSPDGGFEAKQKKSMTSNFQFVVDGMEGACKRVSKVESFTIKQNVLEYDYGGARASIKCASQVEFPQLSFTLPEIDVGPFVAQFQKRGIGGNVPGDRLSGQITMLDNKLQPYMSVSFGNADICNIQPDKLSGADTKTRNFKIDMYTEFMSMEW